MCGTAERGWFLPAADRVSVSETNLQQLGQARQFIRPAACSARPKKRFPPNPTAPISIPPAPACFAATQRFPLGKDFRSL